MTLLYQGPVFLEHQTGKHPERPERLAQISAHLRRTGLDALCVQPTWSPASLDRLARVHSRPYIQSVDDFAKQGGGRIEEDTVVGPRSYEVALHAAGAVCDAVERVVGGGPRAADGASADRAAADRRALCLVRPPGHHALNDSAMGFCLFNSIAVAARLATAELGLDRVLIVDWDVHHGNGTQDAFWTDEQIGFFSIHRWPFYPGTGRAEETGSGPGLGATLNLPVEMGTSRDDYRDRFRSALEKIASRLRPQLVLISAGFDSHRDDPIGSLGLESEDFHALTTAVLDVADEFAGGRVVSVLEGGYNPGILAGCVEIHLREMLDRK